MHILNKYTNLQKKSYIVTSLKKKPYIDEQKTNFLGIHIAKNLIIGLGGFHV